MNANVLRGRFTLIEVLGQGGMGQVFRAHDHELGADVALKRLYPEAVASGEELAREFRVLAHFTHPHVVTLHELHADEAGQVMTMELVADVGTTRRPAPLPADTLRELCGQTANALHALHSSGIVHGDIKPSNVLHTASGRTVLTDFGFSSLLGGVSSPGLTPAYGAPEVLSGSAPSAASDAYALGVMLHDALAPTPAFQGPLQTVYLDKTMTAHLDPGCGPDDLRDLVRGLTRRDPGERLPLPIVAQRLGAASSSWVRPWLHRTVRMVGRDRELERLLALAELARRGARTVALIEGPTGIGKTALLESVATRLGAPLLRCYPNERLVGAIAREILGLGDATPLLVCVDDLHRADPESLVALVERLNRLTRGQGAFIVASWRDDEVPTAEVAEVLRGATAACDLAVVRLEPLGRLASLELAREVLGHEDDAGAAERLAAVAAGNPLALALVGERTVPDVIAGLPGTTRSLLELVASARTAVPADVLLRASGQDPAAYLVELQRLRIARLVSTSVRSGLGGELRLAHDLVAQSVGAIARETYLRLADGFLAAGAQAGRGMRAGAALALAAAGETTRAAELALTAADEARADGDAEREAKMLSLALEGAPDGSDRRARRERLAEALEAARRLGQAGLVLRELAAEATPEAAAELRQRALEALLLSGEHAEAKALLAESLAAIDARAPRRLLPTVIRILYFYRTREAREVPDLASRGSGAGPEELDVLHAVSLGYAMFEPLASAWFQVSHVKAALRTDDPYRLVRALCIHLVHSATSFIDPCRQAVANARIEAALARVGDDVRADLDVMIASARAAVAWVSGDLASARVEVESAIEAARRCPRRTWEADSSWLVRCAVAEEAGDWASLRTWTDEGMANALARGDRYLQLNLRARSSSFLRLLEGDPQASLDDADWASQAWPSAPGLFALYTYLARVRGALYRGDPAQAVHEAEAGLAVLARAFLLQSHYHAGWIHFARMQAALQLGRVSTGRARARLVKRAEKLAHKVERSCSRTQVHATRALLAIDRGDAAGAEALFEGVHLAGLGALVRAGAGDDDARNRLVASGVADPMALARALVLPAR